MAFATLESKEKLQMRVEKATRQRLRGKSEPEIQKELEKVSATLKAGPRTYEEYESASYEIKSYWEFAMSAAVDKVLQAHQDEQKKAAAKIKNGVERMWKGESSTDESEQAWKTAEKFMELYPQVRPTDTATGAAFRKYLRANNLDPRELSSWETALSVLAATNQPEIFLSPKAAGVGPEEELGGYQLRSYPNLHLLLRRAPDEATRKFRGAYKPELSADNFKKEYLPETGAPYYIQARIKRAADTLVSWHPDFVITDDNIELIVRWINENKLQYDMNGFEAAYQTLSKSGNLERRAGAIVHGGEMTMTNFEPRAHGAPALPDKASLAAKIRNLSSTDLLKFYQDNPGARAAVDAM